MGMQDANFAKLTSMHFYSWEKGLKTGMYYLRTKAAADAIKFTVDAEMVRDQKDRDAAYAEISCSLDNPDECLACGS